jgi:hypothetical protein
MPTILKTDGNDVVLNFQKKILTNSIRTAMLSKRQIIIAILVIVIIGIVTKLAFLKDGYAEYVPSLEGFSIQSLQAPPSDLISYRDDLYANTRH